MKTARYVLLFLICGNLVFAGWPVTVIGNLYDSLVKEPLDAGRWAKALNAANDQISEIKNVYSQTQTVAKFIGDGKVSVQDLRNISQIAGTLGNISGNDTTLGGAFQSTQAQTQDFGKLFNSIDDLKWNINDTLTIGDRKMQRDPTLYQALAAAQNLADTTRDYMKQAAGREDNAQKRIDQTINDLQAKPNPTSVDIQTALVKLQRENLAQQSEIYRLQLMLAMQEQERQAEAAKSKAIATQTVEQVIAEHKATADDTDKIKQEERDRVKQQIFTTEQQPDINNGAIKVWLPPGS